MASTQSENKQSKSYTAPKGRPTTHNIGDVKQRRMSPTMEWVLAIIVLLIVIGAIMYFFADVGRGGGGHGGAGGAHGSPVDTVVQQITSVF